MTVEKLMNICSQLPYDAEIRFACKRQDNPHDDYYDVDGAYYLQFCDADDSKSVLYLYGIS